MTKQDVIKQAYQDAGVDWEQVKEYVDDNGWITMFNSNNKQVTPNFFEMDFTHQYVQDNIDSGFDPKQNIHSWRLKSLSGIEDNNGWIKIESEDDLPKEEGQYFVYGKRIDIFTGRLSNAIHHVTGKPIFTHYQPINKPSKPLY